jgi:hypothetical protein
VNPDPWAAERFKDMTLAYEVLRDEKRRADYDLLPPEAEASYAPRHDDASFLYILRNVLTSLRQQQEVQRYARNPVRSVVYAVASDILEKSMTDFESALRNPRIEVRPPIVIAVAERFLQNIDPTEDIANDRSSEHLRTGVLGMVGLARVAQIVGREATPRAKEAAARAVMFALAGALVEAGLIQQRMNDSTIMLSAGAYAASVQNAFIELDEVVGSSAAG